MPRGFYTRAKIERNALCPAIYLQLKKRIEKEVLRTRSLDRNALSSHLKKRYPELFTLVHYNGTYSSTKLVATLSLPLDFPCLHCGGPTRACWSEGKFAKYCSLKCVSNSEEVKEQKVRTTMKNWGVEHGLSHKGIRQKGRDSMLEKFGVDHHMKSKAVKKAMEERCVAQRGVRNPMMDPLVRQKTIDSLYRTKEFTSKSGRVFQCQGFEPVVLTLLDQHPKVKDFTTAVTELPRIPYKFKRVSRQYEPDIGVTLKDGRKFLVEVKCDWSMKRDALRNKAKFKAAVQFCSEHEATFLVAMVENRIIRWIKPTR